MAGTNSYFQIVVKDNKTYIRLFPSVDGGEPLSLSEVRDYLSFNNIVPESTDYITAISEMASIGGKEPVDVLLTEKTGFPINEYFVLKFTQDKMAGVGRFYPPSTGGASTSKAEILNDMAHRGVKAPVKEEIIDAFLADRKYCTNVLLVRGIEPVQGSDASIEYFFNTNPNMRPALNEDGSVDFFNLETISKCSKGQILAKLTPEVLGKKGMRVTGEPVLPRDVRTAKIRFANNCSLSEDGLTLISNVDGHVSLVDDKIFVSDVYEVVDVDTSTGNIDYDGSVLVKGNIKTGFKVKATGNVDVKGVVEGAEVDAGGNVIIARGFNGMGRGVINAGGNVVARFVENGTIICGGNLNTEALMHSKINASGNVEVTGKKGFIVGGSVKALGNVLAKTIGSEMGGDTEIEVGVDPKIKNKAVSLEETLKKTQENIDKLTPVIVTFTKRIKAGDKLSVDQIRYFKQLSEQYKTEKENFDRLNKEYDEALFEIEGMPTDSCIIVSGNVYPGAEFTINEVSQRITKACMHSRFVRDGADIRIKPI